MRDLIIYGAGDIGEEFVWYIKDINEQKEEWNLLGFVDDGMNSGDTVAGLSVLGKMDFLLKYEKEVYVICSVALPEVKRKIIKNLSQNSNIKFPVLIHPKATISYNCRIGEGTCIGANAVISVNADIGSHVLINSLAMISHHVKIGSYTMIAPGCNLGGHVKIGESVDMGIGCSVMMLAKVGDNAVLGAGAVVVRDIPQSCTAVGIPAKPIKYRKVSN